MKRKIATLGLALLFAFVSTGCKEDKPAPAPENSSPSKSSAAKSPDKDDEEALKQFLSGKKSSTPANNADVLPPGHPPIDQGRGARANNNQGMPAGHPAIPGAGQASKRDLPPLTYTAPESWTENPPSRPFRAAEFVIPSSDEGTEDAQMIVYYFGPGQGGGVEDNLARWKGMFTTEDGQPVGDDAVAVGKMDANGLTVTTIDVKGRYSDMMSRPNQAGPTEEIFRLLGAIVETPNGKWFFKGVGPAPTMTANRDAFMTMLKSMKPS